MKFNICVAIPVKSAEIEVTRIIINKVLETNPEFIEFRLDYIDDIVDITPEFLINLLNLTGPNVRSIFTFRHPKEGGISTVSDIIRYKIISMLIEARPEYIDIEMNTDLETLKKIIDQANDFSVKIIFSYHDFKKTPDYEIAIKILEEFKEKLLENHIIDFLSIKKTLYKLIFTAHQFEDNLIPLELCQYFSKKERDQKIIAFCMGDLGIISRLMCVKAGSFFTFASFEDATAPGQINIKLIREFHQILFNS